MKQFENVKVGDKVWSILYGWGKVIDTKFLEAYPINVKFIEGNICYTLNGKSRINDINPTLFWDEIKFEIPSKPKQLVNKTIIKYCNLYNLQANSIALHDNIAQCHLHGSNNAIAKGAKVIIEYQIEE